MKKKTIIAFFCATFSVCAIYGGLRYTVSSGTSQVTMADTFEEENSMGDIVSPCSSKDHISIRHSSFPHGDHGLDHTFIIISEYSDVDPVYSLIRLPDLHP